MMMTEERAREILGELIQEDGTLISAGGDWVRWHADDKEADLEGDFTADQLEAIAFWMRRGK